MPRDWGGPYVEIACFCSDQPRPNPKGGHDIIGVFDAMVAPAGNALVDGFLILVLVAGGQAGKTARMRVEVRNPDGVREVVAEGQIGAFNGAEEPTVFVNPMRLELMGVGLYHIFVHVNGHLLTRLPMDVSDLTQAGSESLETGFLSRWVPNGFEA